MPDGRNQVALTESRDITAMPLDQALDVYTPNLVAALPRHVSVDHFKRMVITAVNVNPELIAADRRTLFNACVKCASDGLLPDGREAALVVYRTKIKDRQGREHYIDAAQYLPMIAGIRKRMRNSGDVLSATAEVVCKNDRFKYSLGDNAFIEHEPPALDMERGPEIGAYAIIRLGNGEVLRDVMRYAEIERVRSTSRAKDGPAWKNWWGEMARKTVLKRCAKSAPQAAELERLLQRDEELPELPAPEDLPAIPSRPQPQEFMAPVAEAQPEPATPNYVVVDVDGEEHEFAEPNRAEEVLTETFAEAARRGRDAVQAAAENSSATINALRNAGEIERVGRLSAAYNDALKQTSAAPKRPREGRANPSAPGPSPRQGDAAKPDRSWLRRVATLPTPERDLISDEINWQPYIDSFLELIDLASPADAQALRVSDLEAMRRLKLEDGDGWRKITQKLADKGRGGAEKGDGA